MVKLWLVEIGLEQPVDEPVLPVWWNRTSENHDSHGDRQSPAVLAKLASLKVGFARRSRPTVSWCGSLAAVSVLEGASRIVANLAQVVKFVRRAKCAKEYNSKKKESRITKSGVDCSCLRIIVFRPLIL